MRKPRFILLACLAALAVLAGSLLSPVAQASRSSIAQDETKSRIITISGIAILPDGGAAADFPVVVKLPAKVVNAIDDVGNREGGPPRLLSQSTKEIAPFTVVGSGMTDAAGRFSIKVNHQARRHVQLEIGDKEKSAWIIKAVMLQAKDIDVGQLQLRMKVTED